MTRLTEIDLRDLVANLADFEAGLREVSGLDLRGLAARACRFEGGGSPLEGARIAAVPITAGLGCIPCFSACVRTVLAHLGCDAFATEQADVRGLQEALARGAEVVFLADDERFVAVSVRRGVCADNDPCTAAGYAAALEAAAGGLAGRDVLLLGLGPVGRAAAKRLAELGARVLAVEPNPLRRELGVRDCAVEPVALAEGLARAELVFDAAPAADLIDADWVAPASIAAVPALPSGFTGLACAALGARHIHEPLAVGVAVMALEALAGAPAPREHGS